MLAGAPSPWTRQATRTTRASGQRRASTWLISRHTTPVGLVTTPIPFTVEELDAVAFDADGLVPAIVQEEGTNQVLMFAWMNRDALQRTLETGRTWFWSRSRREFWCKGETSGDRQYVRACYYDCDMDVLLCIVEQEGRGACHTGERSCFYRTLED